MNQNLANFCAPMCRLCFHLLDVVFGSVNSKLHVKSCPTFPCFRKRKILAKLLDVDKEILANFCEPKIPFKRSLHNQFIWRFGILSGPNIVSLRSKMFGKIFGPNILLHRGTIFGTIKIPNRQTNWMCRCCFRMQLHLLEICTLWRYF